MRRQACGYGRSCLSLAMIATRRCYDALNIGMLSFEPIHERNRTTNFERTGRRVVLMLDPNLSANRLIDQRPGILWRGRHSRVNEICRLL